MAARRNLLLTVDAFGTIIKPRIPIAEQYIEESKRHGLDLDALCVKPETINAQFKRAFNRMSLANPFYGKQKEMKYEEWWAETIRQTLAPFARPDDPSKWKPPPLLIPSLIDRFSSPKGYELYPDVLPFLFELTQPTISTRSVWPYAPAIPRTPLSDPSQYLLPLTRTQLPNHSKGPITLLGVLSNSDPRIPHIFASLGIAHYFHQYTLSHTHLLEKPARAFFRLARLHALQAYHGPDYLTHDPKTGIEKPEKWRNPPPKGSPGWDFIHIGDDLYMDYVATFKIPDYKGVWIDRVNGDGIIRGGEKPKFQKMMSGCAGKMPPKGVRGWRRRRKIWREKRGLRRLYKEGEDPIEDVVSVGGLAQVFGWFREAPEGWEEKEMQELDKQEEQEGGLLDPGQGDDDVEVEEWFTTMTRGERKLQIKGRKAEEKRRKKLVKAGLKMDNKEAKRARMEERIEEKRRAKEAARKPIEMFAQAKEGPEQQQQQQQQPEQSKQVDGKEKEEYFVFNPTKWFKQSQR